MYPTLDTILSNTYVIKKRKKQWSLDCHQPEINSLVFSDEIFQLMLFKYDFLLKIDSFTVVNLNFVSNCFLNNSDGFLVINEILFHIPRRFISQVREAYKKHLLKKFEKLNSPNGNAVLSSQKAYIPRRFLNLNINKIKFLSRKGSLTTIEFFDGEQEQFYEPLKNFEVVLNGHENIFFRINRNIIINVKLIESIKIQKETKTAEISIGGRKFIISRRQLPSFKRKYHK